MTIKFHCACGHRIGAPESFAGRRAKCPGCGAVVEIPAASPPPPQPRAMPHDDTDYNVAVEGTDPDLLFGRLAVKAGYLTEEQVQGLLGSQARAAAAGAPVTIGELCRSRGLLTSAQVQSLLLAQGYALLRAEDKLIGRLAVRNGFATDEDVKAALEEQKQEYRGARALPRRLGEILVEMGTLTDQQLRALLSAQARLARQVPPRDVVAIPASSAGGAHRSASPAKGAAPSPRSSPAPVTPSRSETPAMRDAAVGWTRRRKLVAAATLVAAALVPAIWHFAGRAAGRAPQEPSMAASAGSSPGTEAESGGKAEAVAVSDAEAAVVNEAIANLTSADPTKRSQAAYTLERMGSKGRAAVPDLVRALEGVDAQLRHEAAQALGAIDPGSDEAIGALSRRLADPDGLVRLSSLNALTKIGVWNDAAVAGLSGLLVSDSDGGYGLTRKAYDVLIALRPTRVDALVLGLKSKDEWVRGSCLSALMALPDPAPKIIDLVVAEVEAGRVCKDPNDRKGPGPCLDDIWRCLASTAPASLPHLARLLRIEDEAVREDAALLLAACGADALSELGKEIESTDPSVRRAVAWGLRFFDGRAPRRRVGVAWWPKPSQTADPSAAARLLLARLGDPDEAFRREARSSLGTLGRAPLAGDVRRAIDAAFQPSAASPSGAGPSAAAPPPAHVEGGDKGEGDQNAGAAVPPPAKDAGAPAAVDPDGGHGATADNGEASCPTCGGKGTLPCTTCTDGKVTVECEACLGTGSPSAARGAEWQEHMEAGQEAGDSLDFRTAEKEWRAALSIAETFGEHDLRLMKTLDYLGVLLQGPLKQKTEGEAMFRRGQEIGRYVNAHGVPEEKKCGKCKGTGQVTRPCPDCKGRRAVPCPDCGGKKAGGGASDGEAVPCPTCDGRGTVPCANCTDGKATADCPVCRGTGSPSAARETEWRQHLEAAGQERDRSHDYRKAEKELRAALSIAETFGEHDTRLMETLNFLGGLLQDDRVNERSEGEAMRKRAQEIERYIGEHGVPEEKKCEKCMGTGKIMTTCTVCRGTGAAPCPDCGGRKAGGGGGSIDDERANSLLTVAQAFETNKKPDLAIQKYQELLTKYPETKAAATAKKRLGELQAGDRGR